ncbi:MAG: FtsX-like permease family protein [Silvibacterium sp.]|jgi:ABC-type antimicrobial peptide transport system permease subunit
MAYSVQQRTQEMGIRMALGADRSRIFNLVVWQGMYLALIGAVIGMAAAFAFTRFIASFLFGVKPYDPIVLVTVPAILSAVALYPRLKTGPDGIPASGVMGRLLSL